jgi:hypothetical protein
VKSSTKQLRRVFGESSWDAPATTTGQVLTRPADVHRQQGQRCVDQMNMRPILTDLAAIAAREVANELHAYGLRGADFADAPDLPKEVLKKILAEIAQPSEDFEKAFRAFLRMRG